MRSLLSLNVGRWTLNVGRFCLFLSLASALAQEQPSTAGYGSATSVSPELSITRPAAALLTETEALVKIFSASIRTAEKNRR